MSRTQKLVRYKGKYWWSYGLIDCDGWLILVSLTDPSTGVIADPARARVVTGAERERQLEAIGYFQRKGVCHCR